MSQLRAICVFCGSSAGVNPRYRDSAFHVGRTLAEQGIQLVYGGGSVGLMGAVADGALETGGRVVGIIPRGLADRERMHAGATEMQVVDTMHTRKARMAELSDAFIAMPGGMGTLEEFTEIFTWGQLGIHAKPFGLLNTEGFYDPFVAMLDHMVREGFLGAHHRALVCVEPTIEALLEALRAWSAPTQTIWRHQE
ncbi:MAG: TIGR00730 family Rossman fold protein [bacterium]